MGLFTTNGADYLPGHTTLELVYSVPRRSLYTRPRSRRVIVPRQSLALTGTIPFECTHGTRLRPTRPLRSQRPHSSFSVSYPSQLPHWELRQHSSTPTYPPPSDLLVPFQVHFPHRLQTKLSYKALLQCPDQLNSIIIQLHFKLTFQFHFNTTLMTSATP